MQLDANRVYFVNDLHTYLATQNVLPVLKNKQVSFLAPELLGLLRKSLTQIDITMDLAKGTAYYHEQRQLESGREEFWLLYHLLLRTGTSCSDFRLSDLIAQSTDKPVNTRLAKLISRLRQRFPILIDEDNLWSSGHRYGISEKVNFVLICDSLERFFQDYLLLGKNPLPIAPSVNE